MSDEIVELDDSTPAEVDGTLDQQDDERLTKAEQVAQNQKIRAEKAEAELKKLKAQSSEKHGDTTPKNEAYTLQDIRALSKVHDDDVERVEKFAKTEGITIAEALKAEDMQAVLQYRENLRKTAEATNTGASRPGTSKTNPETIIAVSRGGKEVDPIALAEAEHAVKMRRLEK